MKHRSLLLQSGTLHCLCPLGAWIGWGTWGLNLSWKDSRDVADALSPFAFSHRQTKCQHHSSDNCLHTLLPGAHQRTAFGLGLFCGGPANTAAAGPCLPHREELQEMPLQSLGPGYSLGQSLQP